MKTIILISLLYIGCCPCKKITKPVTAEIDFMKPSIDTLGGSYYITRCACFSKNLSDDVLYPSNIKEAYKLQDKGYKCSRFSVPIEYLN